MWFTWDNMSAHERVPKWQRWPQYGSRLTLLWTLLCAVWTCPNLNTSQPLVVYSSSLSPVWEDYSAHPPELSWYGHLASQVHRKIIFQAHNNIECNAQPPGTTRVAVGSPLWTLISAWKMKQYELFFASGAQQECVLTFVKMPIISPQNNKVLIS